MTALDSRASQTANGLAEVKPPPAGAPAPTVIGSPAGLADAGADLPRRDVSIHYFALARRSRRSCQPRQVITNSVNAVSGSTP